MLLDASKTTTDGNSVPPVLLQRACIYGRHIASSGECEECKTKRDGTLQRAAMNFSAVPESEVPPVVHEVLDSPGQPLDTQTRAFMEPRFGHDFSKVRVHTGAKAANSARVLNAFAYTVGNDVVLDQARCGSGTISGKWILAHELTHVIQQQMGDRSSNKESYAHEQQATEELT